MASSKEKKIKTEQEKKGKEKENVTVNKPIGYERNI
jgi:hypothetical protein